MIRLFFTSFLILSLAGCGYTTGSLLPAKYRKIAIDPFQNKINNTEETTSDRLYVPALETKVRGAVIDRFLFDGNLRIADADKADLVLDGDVIAINQDELRQDTNQNVEEYRIRVSVSLTLKDNATGLILWKEPNFEGETTYFLTGAQAQSQSAAIDAALTDLASRIVERTVENW
jgi:hypothetical protein